MSDDLLARLQAAGSAEERDWLVTEVLLESLPAELQQAAWAAAVPHWFDAEILAALLDQSPGSPGVEECAALYAELQSLPFVEPFEARGGHNVHGVTRAAMLARLWEERRDEYMALSARAAAYFAGSDEAEIRIEEIYHQLIADPDAGTEALSEQGWAWHDPPLIAYDLVYALAGAALEHAGAGRLGWHAAGTANLLSGRIDTLYSRIQEAKGKLEAALRASEPVSELRAASNWRLGDVHSMIGEHAEARARYVEALTIYAATGDRQGEANCILGLGDVHLKLHEYAEARGRYEEAHQIYVDIADLRGQAHCISALGGVHYSQAEYAEARERYEEALRIYASTGNRLMEAGCIQGLGTVHYMLQEYVEAWDLYQEARRIYAAVGDRPQEASCIYNLGNVHYMLHEHAEAWDLYQEARRIYAAVGDRLQEASCIYGLASMHRILHEYAEAREHYQEARLIYISIDAHMGEANCNLGLGDVARAEEDWPEAERLYRAAVKVYRELGQSFNAGLALGQMGWVAEERGDRSGAAGYYEEALAIYEGLGVKEAERFRWYLARVRRKEEDGSP